MTVQVLLHTGENVHYTDRLVGESATLDRDDYWYTVTEAGVLRIYRRHLDGSKLDASGHYAEELGVTMTFSPSGWASVDGHRANPDHRADSSSLDW